MKASPPIKRLRNSGMIAILRGHLLTCASVGVEHQSCDYFFRCAPVCDRDEGCGNTSWKCGEDETLAVCPSETAGGPSPVQTLRPSCSRWQCGYASCCARFERRSMEC